MSETVSIRLTLDEIAKVDELRGDGVSRSAFVRTLLRGAGPDDEAPSREEALLLLARSARAGKVVAQVALARELRGEAGDRPEGELARLLRGDD